MIQANVKASNISPTLQSTAYSDKWITGQKTNPVYAAILLRSTWKLALVSFRKKCINVIQETCPQRGRRTVEQ